MSNVKLVPTLSHIIEDFEYSVHMCPTTMRNDVMKIFTEKTFADSEDIVVIPTVQKSEVDLSQAGDKQDNEKDRLLETFMEWASLVCRQLWDRTFWADVIDPSTGQPYFGDADTATFATVQGDKELLNYPTETVDGQTVLSHPEWKTACYAGTMFTNAPVDVVLEVLGCINDPEEY
mmetsp:Transcript_12723/g.21773  ORF Transcript_12723/g.21773 Transcript_12723/m.21773 type:complete len:176 (+) Transcript_12723:265-792(+)